MKNTKYQLPVNTVRPHFKTEEESWTEWLPFPDPRQGKFITAPFGPGVYELRRADTKQLILRGSGKNCAYRMSSLLPAPLGAGTRNNKEKRDYVLANLENLEYRCCACRTKAEAGDLEDRLHREMECYFPT